ncbi:glycosyl transferase family protein [Pacificibacter marinus]|uniref:Anthranilate phosphoribosyltransferase n=1 Tax=Pacificibacter marinus TaxID=658057 RepID=A0A1Y5S7Y4_9RHOB|nr:glycosyl transferase family protein [Pacificibacter marinus]SEK76518.1 Anthranilate phosphoribosyltransferase [Pacificibacter marinus]SLN34504.1 Anthranilate phosphoribosyltransferase [Pacificibacter marinus]
MTLAPYVRILGRGPGRSRALTYTEAYEAMQIILAGQAAPESVGALLMLLRMKGEVADEIAGFTQALRDDLKAVPQPDLDWPSYAAGRTRGLPYFLLSAKLVAQAGYSVLMHGFNGEGEAAQAIRDALPYAGIAVCADADAAAHSLKAQGIAYLPLENFAPKLLKLLLLRRDFNLRSCLNTVSRMLNPGGADVSVQGVFHPSYRELQSDASQILSLKSLTVIKGGGGEFERNPSKDIVAFGLRDGAPWEYHFEPDLDETRKLNDGESDPARLAALWSGALIDPFAEGVIQSTAALALDTLGHHNPSAAARTLWTTRDK